MSMLATALIRFHFFHMTSPCPGCGLKSLQIRVDLSSTEHSEIQRQFRSEFGLNVIDSKRAEGLKEMLALAGKDIEDCDSEVARLYDQILVVKAEKQRYYADKIQFREIKCLPTMAISFVCSRWRELALLSPSLWANLDVDTDHRIKISSAVTVDRYLERSGDCPLMLKLGVWDSGDKMELPALISLTRHAHRWKTFQYEGPRSLTYHNVLSEKHLPSLAELYDIDPWDLDLFEHCPKLRVLATRWPAGPIPKVFHCSHLDHLKFPRQSLTDLVEALRTWPSLESLELRYKVTDPNLEGVPQGTLGTWCNIRSLTFLDAPSDIVFSSFNFPSLNELVILYDHHIHPSLHSYIRFRTYCGSSTPASPTSSQSSPLSSFQVSNHLAFHLKPNSLIHFHLSSSKITQSLSGV
ncbi:hypothetical protein BDP27DRAFT_1423903 [Rhodocollybia butyracea]|uniref:F-box domain-containing protein n=1 Tax=Rhodocollybia butyracea TaxID=206335 RepID=A0A9P5PNJ2_9AGAR|nr:hypothetical protein BDP27DRAFT_1423903 [Rhodocollybia butyracea]